MEEDKIIDVETVSEEVVVEEVSPSAEGAASAEEGKEEAKKERPSTTLKDALKQAESFAQTLGVALQGRGNVVMVRVNDDALAHLDMLVEAEVTKSRSESAAFLINEGIQANEALFARISTITDKIAVLREQLRKEVKLPTKGSDPEAE